MREAQYSDFLPVIKPMIGKTVRLGDLLLLVDGVGWAFIAFKDETGKPLGNPFETLALAGKRKVLVTGIREVGGLYYESQKGWLKSTVIDVVEKRSVLSVIAQCINRYL
jgi:hypothetical protein